MLRAQSSRRLLLSMCNMIRGQLINDFMYCMASSSELCAQEILFSVLLY